MEVPRLNVPGRLNVSCPLKNFLQRALHILCLAEPFTACMDNSWFSLANGKDFQYSFLEPVSAKGRRQYLCAMIQFTPSIKYVPFVM